MDTYASLLNDSLINPTRENLRRVTVNKTCVAFTTIILMGLINTTILVLSVVGVAYLKPSYRDVQLVLEDLKDMTPELKVVLGDLGEIMPEIKNSFVMLRNICNSTEFGHLCVNGPVTS